jgi:hypothetical protein
MSDGGAKPLDSTFTEFPREIGVKILYMTCIPIGLGSELWTRWVQRRLVEMVSEREFWFHPFLLCGFMMAEDAHIKIVHRSSLYSIFSHAPVQRQ